MIATEDHSFSQRAFLFMLALATSSVHEASGYTVAAPISKPIGCNIPHVDIPGNTRHSHLKIPSKIDTTFFRKDQEVFGVLNRRSSRSTYDLGLGKNKPVVSRRKDGSTNTATSNSDQPRTVVEATQYWNEHQTAREFPAPTSTVIVVDAATAPKPKKTLPVVNPTRRAHDVLAILATDTSDRQATSPQNKPVMVSSAPVQLDVNTIWVEMLIHSEQLKRQGLAAAAAH